MRDKERIQLGFEAAVKKAFAFAAKLNYHIVCSTPTLVTYRAGNRYMNVFHGRRSYAIGAEFGEVGNADEVVTLSEIVNSLSGYGAYRELGGSSKESVVASVNQLASLVQSFPEVLRGKLPTAELQAYRERLTDYYSGKSKKPPNRGRLP
ncbi:MAG: hypothetical protein JO036_01875 [Candidatus Eremiobacteraeota bacterium]|nr:hypothetical protein [Candidatus Eremiobacteraeota bacterium]